MAGKNPNITLAITLVLLTACGGGGGDGGGGGNSTTPATTYSDGLGPTGRVAEAIPISNGLQVYGPVAALDDSGRALVVWSDAQPDISIPATAYYYATGSSQGNWQSPAQIAGLGVNFSWPLPQLRSNGAGDVVVSSHASQLARYSPNNGWQIINAAPPAGFGVGRLLADGSLPVVTEGADTTNPSRYAITVLIQRGSDPFIPLYQLGPMDDVHDVSLIVTPTSSGQEKLALSYVSRTNTTPTGMLSLEHAMLLPDGSSPASSIPSLLVPDSSYCYPWRFGASVSNALVVAMRETRTEDSNCNLIADYFLAPGSIPVEQRFNVEQGFAAGDPRVLMDEQGNALMIWTEVRGNDSTTMRYMWSQSLKGSAWSTPALLASSQNFGAPISMTIAMNAGGNAVALIETLQDGRGYLVKSRFSFNQGWFDWSRIAEGVYTATGDTFDVAVNSQGNAVVVFRMTPCEDRVLLAQGASHSRCGNRTVYALRL